MEADAIRNKDTEPQLHGNLYSFPSATILSTSYSSSTIGIFAGDQTFPSLTWMISLFSRSKVVAITQRGRTNPPHGNSRTRSCLFCREMEFVFRFDVSRYGMESTSIFTCVAMLSGKAFRSKRSSEWFSFLEIDFHISSGIVPIKV